MAPHSHLTLRLAPTKYAPGSAGAQLTHRAAPPRVLADLLEGVAVAGATRRERAKPTVRRACPRALDDLVGEAAEVVAPGEAGAQPTDRTTSPWKVDDWVGEAAVEAHRLVTETKIQRP